MSRRLGLDEAERGIVEKSRGVLARAITLVESGREGDRIVAEQLVSRLAPRTGRARRIGISGPPGVGKSTLIEALGCHLLEQGCSLAVLAIDPSSATTGGSILGDKTRMPRLATDPRAFVRPSPAADHLGGVARKTREAMLLCEAFGFDVVFVETIGVGQSEVEVASMVDTFLLLALPGAGDELQGIKRGIMEAVDLVAVNKADGDNLPRARIAARDLSAALRFVRPRFASFRQRALMVSSTEGTGITELWAALVDHRRAIEQSGELAALRRGQMKRWFWSEIDEHLKRALVARADVASLASSLEAEVAEGRVGAGSAARRVVELFRGAS